MLTADVIEGFSASLLQKNFDAAVQSPPCHREWWELFCSEHKQIAIAAPRRHAKTTAVTQTCTLAAVLFREREYVLVVSDTISQAIQFLGDIKKELLENDQLRALFKIKGFVKETEDDFICMCEDGHTFRVSAKGAEQKIRGLKWNNKRPDLIICDDLENDEIVMNKERRAKFKRWFYAALVPCLSYKGKIMYVGTILHNDSLLESLMPKRYEKYTVIEALKTYSTRPKPGWKAVKYRAHTTDFNDILWNEQYDREWFIQKRQEYVDQGLPDVYSQEFLNIPLDETLAYFRRADFRDITEEDRLVFAKNDWKKHFNFYVATDLAVSEKEVADWSVFVTVGADENGIIYVLDVIRDRMDSKTIVDTLFSIQNTYDPVCISMEKGQIEKAIGPFLRQRMLETGTFPTILPIAPSMDKLTRARSIQARMRAGFVKFDKQADWYLELEEEAALFPRGKHDDQVDALAYIGLILDRVLHGRSEREIEEDEYDEDYEQSGLAAQGRNAYTGY
jgi:predicted phage terminase large subunit-like protein